MGVAVVFPGQGVQRPGMGARWQGGPAWDAVVGGAEDVLGRPVAGLLLDASAEDLSRTAEAQLAVLLASLLAWDAVRRRVGDAVAFAGHSLGQLSALIASGALAPGDGVRLVSARAECTQAAAAERPGRMAAVIGSDLEAVHDACAGLDCWVANDNAPGQVVIAGTPEGLDQAGERALAAGARRVMPVNVGGAFHTPLMEDARRAFAAHLGGTSFADPVAPVVSNGDARAYSEGAGWSDRLADHLVSPVRWRSSMEALVALGADTFVEVGPGGVLAGMAKRTVPDVRVIGVAEPDDVDAVDRAMADR